MRLLVDTNVLVDALRKREPHYAAARKLLAFSYLGEFELWISLSQMGDLMYLLTGGGKASRAQAAAAKLRKLREFVRICPAGEPEVDAAITSGWADLEDALVYQTARSIRADAIISRNGRDFCEGRIPVFTCEEWFDNLGHTLGVEYDEVELPAG